MRPYDHLSLRSPEQISANRAKSFCHENVKLFSDNLSVVLDSHDFEPSRIWNVDEIGCPAVHTKTVKIVASKEKKASRATNIS